MKKLINSSVLLSELILMFAGVVANKKMINSVTERAIGQILADDNHAEKWHVKPDR